VTYRLNKSVCHDCGGKPEPGRSRCEQCKLKHRAADRRRDYPSRNRAIKRRVMEAYGGRCACCGEATLEFLQLDHVNNGGAAHRRMMGYPGGVYRWLIRHRFPPGFQVLRANCHFAKTKYGECPHARAGKGGAR
jgi:hypothetical protein